MLCLDRVSRRFSNGAGVVEASLHLGAGEIVALVGLNGAGKTTLMRLALGMLRPQQGQVCILGARIEDAQRSMNRPLWGRVGALVEAPLAYPELSVRENLHIAHLLRGGSPSSTGNVEEAIETWGLSAIADRRFRHLSAGNRQRVGLAGALQHHPELIVLDEPTNALDPAAVISLREQLTRSAAQGAAVLVSSHHLDEVSRIAHRVELMNAGRLIGALDTQDHDLERVFFERIRRDDEQRAAAPGIEVAS